MTDELARLSSRSIRRLDDDEALAHIALLIDLSGDHKFERGVKRALYLLDELEQRALDPGRDALLQYFRANAWSVRRRLAGERGAWAWENPETQQEILAWSRAVTHPGFASLDKLRKCQILTNRANLLNAVGRFIDAQEGWGHALALLPTFAMANGNRAFGLKHYAGSLYDAGHRGVFLLAAHDAALAATRKGAVYDSAYPPSVPAAFDAFGKDIAAHVPLDSIRSRQQLDGFPLGRSRKERSYRRWCLQERLFLNPLNDLGEHSIAANDVLTLPSMTEVGLGDTARSLMPPIFGFYNQMKQEFVSARYMLFEGANASGVHFSDRGVLLYNTLDYPHFSFGMEQIRASFRLGYSLLDKVAYCINHYWGLGKREDRINFKTVWLKEGKSVLHPRFKDYQNWPLRGLYWLSKEIHDDELKQTTNPDARELHDLRNHLEHKYLQVHEGWAIGSVDNADTADESLRKSIASHDLEAKALRVLKIARSALCHLSLAIEREERIRAAERPEGIVLPMTISTWEDNRKRRE